MKSRGNGEESGEEHVYVGSSSSREEGRCFECEVGQLEGGRRSFWIARGERKELE